MEIERPVDPNSIVAADIVDVESLEATLTERRVPRSFKKPAEASGDDADSDNADTDEALVEETATDVLEDADKIIKNPNSSIVVNGVLGGSSNPEKQSNTEKLLKKAKERDVADIDVQAVKADEETVITGKNGTKKKVKLHAGEKSREVNLNGEKVLVLDETLSKEEVREETTQYIVEELEEIASEFNLGVQFDPFFNFLLNDGFPALVPYFGAFGIPKLQSYEFDQVFQLSTNHDKKYEEHERDRLET